MRPLVSLGWGLPLVCLASLLFAMAFYGVHDSSTVYGIYQMFRSLQFLIVLLATAGIAFTQRRRITFARIALVSFCLIAAGVLLTASGAVNTGEVTPLLPASPALAGPWSGYILGGDGVQGCGFVSYNHAYTGIQLILSGSAAYLFFERSPRIRLLICCLLLVCTFVTESRADFLAAAALVFLLEWKQAKSNLFVLVVLVAVGGLWTARSLATEKIVDRQSSSVSALNDDGLSGRTGIWQDHVGYFAAHPLNVLYGAGFGYASKASATNAHMLYLHVMTETGLAGLALFLYVQRQTLRLLRMAGARTMFWTVCALLLTGLTQETLYPVAAFSHFLGFYLSALVVAIRVARAGAQSTHQVARTAAVRPLTARTLEATP
jgi:hypothetical protein